MGKSKKKNQGEPPLGDFRKCPSARKLFESLGRAFPVKVNKQRTLNSFVIWLIERLIDKDVSNPSSAESELKEWYQLLKSCRIDDQTIIDGFVELEQSHVSEHPLDARRLHIVETELRELIRTTASLPPAPSKSSTAHKIQKPSGTLSKPMDEHKHLNRRVSVLRIVAGPDPSKSTNDYTHPDRRLSGLPARNDSTAAFEGDMSDYIHPGRRVLVSTPQESPKHDSPPPTLAHMHPDRAASVSVDHSSPAPEIMYGRMHPDRMMFSREAAPEPGELIEKVVPAADCIRTGTGRQGKSNTFDPSCPDLPFLSGANAMAMEDSVRQREKKNQEQEWEKLEQEEKQKQTQKQKEKEKEKEKGKDLSFLTGSNRMVFGDDWALARTKKKKKKAAQTELVLEYGESPVDVGNAKSATKGDKEFTIPGNYVCNRCNVRGKYEPPGMILLMLTLLGHLIQDCPTNGDWRYAVKAPEDYTCNFCGKQADHYIDDCPRKPSKGSRNGQTERDAPRRVVSDTIRDSVIDSYRPEPRSHKRHRSMDSEFDDDDYLASRPHRRGTRGRKSRRADDDPESNVSFRGRAGTNDSPWGDLKSSIVGYLDPDKPVGDEPPTKVYTNRRPPLVSPDPCEEGRLSYYDVPSEDAQPEHSTLKNKKRKTPPKKTQLVVPKFERSPIRIANAPPPRIRVGPQQVGQMIEEERDKNDLIPSFFKMFLGKKVYCRTKAKRPVAIDFIDMPSESEGGDDDAMETDQAQDSVKNEQGDMSAQLKSRLSPGPSVDEPQQATNSSVIQHLHDVIDVDDDVVMTEARPSVIVSGLGDVTDLTGLSDGESQSHIVVVDD
ncbi:hypothetical protein QC762_601480 [Podospora pseudocomata]|uniref:CCHC-type domain-containing protein n=1 Tax=Podospora pseudocomata TaxID=2093779 RepID=A0ABR0G7F2_9PEZI|nr:hypothetical protein QC762_601480 [Podospora pseudocomata]